MLDSGGSRHPYRPFGGVARRVGRTLQAEAAFQRWKAGFTRERGQYGHNGDELRVGKPHPGRLFQAIHGSHRLAQGRQQGGDLNGTARFANEFALGLPQDGLGFGLAAGRGQRHTVAPGDGWVALPGVVGAGDPQVSEPGSFGLLVP
jgi:hypothetical protein